MVSSVDRVKSFLVVPKLGLSSVDDPQRLSGTWLKFLNLSVSSLINIYNNLFDWKIQVLPKKQIIPNSLLIYRTQVLGQGELLDLTQLIQSLSCHLAQHSSSSHCHFCPKVIRLHILVCPREQLIDFPRPRLKCYA